MVPYSALRRAMGAQENRMSHSDDTYDNANFLGILAVVLIALAVLFPLFIWLSVAIKG